MTKLIYIISHIDKAISFEWIYRDLNRDLNISFVFLGNKIPETGRSIKEQGGSIYFIKLENKRDYLLAGIRLTHILLKNKPDVVHTHLRDADILGLGISKILRIKKRLTTRHFSTFNQKYHPKSVKLDRSYTKWASDVVAISENVKQVLIEEGVNASKISLIHHGFDIDEFQNTDESKIRRLKEKYQTLNNYPVIGVISRYIEWKGIPFIIEAFKKLLIDYPNAKLILANAIGPLKKEIQEQLKTLPENSYVEIAFEKDLFSLYQLFDVFVHTPTDSKIEAFGQIYVEALAAGIPSIFTLSGVAHEFISDKQNAIVVDYKKSNQILDGIKLYLENQSFKKEIIINGKNSIKQFRLELFTNKLKRLYEK